MPENIKNFSAKECKLHNFFVTYFLSILFIIVLITLAYGIIIEGKSLTNTLIVLPFIFFIFLFSQLIWALMVPLELQFTPDQLIMKGPFNITRKWNLNCIYKLVNKNNISTYMLYKKSIFKFVHINKNISNNKIFLRKIEDLIKKNNGLILK